MKQLMKWVHARIFNERLNDDIFAYGAAAKG